MVTLMPIRVQKVGLINDRLTVSKFHFSPVKHGQIWSNCLRPFSETDHLAMDVMDHVGCFQSIISIICF